MRILNEERADAHRHGAGHERADGHDGRGDQMGTAVRAKRIAQTAADAATIAGALDYEYNGSTSSATTVAQTAAALNGIPSTNVAVHFNPTIPSHNTFRLRSGDCEPAKSDEFHKRVLSISDLLHGDIESDCRHDPSDACIYVLDPTDASALYIQGRISTPNCGIQVNSNSPDAFCDQGSATIEAFFLHIVGGQSGKGKCAKAPEPPR